MKKHTFKQRLLDPLKGREIPSYMLFTDTETHSEIRSYQEVQIFTLGWIFAWKSSESMTMRKVKREYFDNSLEYCKYFDRTVKLHKSVTVYGHNIFFDLQCAGFFKYFTSEGWELEWLYDKGLTYILRIVKNKMKILLISTTNYYDCSIRELGNMVRLKKLKVSFKGATKAQLKRYCYRDTEIVLQGIWYYIRFIRDNDLGRMAMTKSSQALVSYRTRFMTRKIFIHEDERVISLERSAYFGGRTEAYYIGDVPGKKFLMLDINGMYPFIMQSYKYPSKMVCYMEGEDDSKYTSMLGGYGMIAEVDVSTPEPIFAVRHKGKLIFPTGQFRAFLCTEALRLAVRKRYVKKFYRASLYHMEELFWDYVQFFQDLRLKYSGESNKVMTKLCKYMHNSLYGKFGERDIVTIKRDNKTGPDYLRREIWDSVCGGWWTETHFMNKILMQHYEGEGFHSFPAIAAHITENARLELWSLIDAVGRERVLYCDTDSIMIRASDLKYVDWDFTKDKLGALKIQKRFSSFHIDGAKNYRTDGQRHIKGIPDNASEISPGTFEFESFQRMISCLRAGQSEGIQIKPVIRELTHRYDKGVVSKDGIVSPYHLTFFEPLS